MCKMFSGEALTSDGVFEEFAPQSEFDSFEEWRDTYISLLMDVVDDCPNAERVAEKLQNGDYEVDSYCEGSTEYIYVTVDIF